MGGAGHGLGGFGRTPHRGFGGVPSRRGTCPPKTFSAKILETKRAFTMGKVVPFPVISDEITETMRDAAKIPNPRYAMEIPTNDRPSQLPQCMEAQVLSEPGTCWRCNCGSFEFYYYMDGVLECSKCYTEQVGWDGRT